jgi:hypothetical protein
MHIYIYTHNYNIYVIQVHEHKVARGAGHPPANSNAALLNMKHVRSARGVAVRNTPPNSMGSLFILLPQVDIKDTQKT